MRISRFKTTLMGGSAAAVALAMFAAPTVVAAQTATYSFNIPAQDLGAALRAFGRASRQQVVFDAADTRGKRSTALVGTFTADAGLAQLLGGTGLTVRRGASGVLIVSDPGRAEAGDPVEMVASELEDVVVTGTHIAGAPVGSPTFTYTQEDFERVGATSISEFIQTLPQAFGGARTADTNFSTVPGLNQNNTFGSSIDLRGLGAGGTLVLVNGQRRIRTGAADSVDISMIPLGAVERIEILTDGASAIYGSDAVAGVVNIILRKDYRGAQTRVTAGATTRGGRDEISVSQTLGMGWGSGNAILSLNYSGISALPAPDPERPLANRSRLTAAPPSEVYGATLSLSQGLLSWLKFESQASYSHRQNFFFSDPAILPVTEYDAESENYDLGATLRVELPGSWDAELEAGYSETSNLYQPVAGGGSFNFFTSFGNDLRFVSGSLDGVLFTAPAGPVEVAVGVGHREENYSTGSSFAVGGIPGEPVLSPPVSFNVDSAFGEVRIPLMADQSGRRTLVASFASRYENYSNFGDSLNTKVGLEWLPIEGIKFRGSWGTSFRAPTPLETATPLSYNLQALPADVITAAGVPGGAAWMINRLGSDPDLNEETSTSWTIGFDLSPTFIEGLTAQVTYFNTEFRDRIAQPPGTFSQRLLDQTYAELRIVRGQPGFDAMVASLLAGPPRVSSCPLANRPPAPSTACTIDPNSVYAITFGETTNLATTRDSGVDFTIDYVTDTPVGEFNFGLNGTWLFDFSRQLVEGGPEVQFLDTTYNPVDLRMRATVGWRRDAWAVTGAFNYIDNYMNTAPVVPERVAAWGTVDLNIQYDLEDRFGSGLLASTRLILNVDNIFDADPPPVRPFFTGGVAYDAANADPYGTAVSLTLVKNW